MFRPGDDPPGRRGPPSIAAAAAVRGGAKAAGDGPTWPASPGWLYHHLTISGPAEPLADFSRAARGAGVIPWQLDFARIEEDIFVRAVAQPAGTRRLTVAGCRILARQFRERVESREAKAVSRVGQSDACPFDLHQLLPVPAAILALRPTDPAALAWLATTGASPPACVRSSPGEKPATGRRLPAGHGVIGYGFFTEGETPHAAIAQLRDRWPALRSGSCRGRPTDAHRTTGRQHRGARRSAGRGRRRGGGSAAPGARRIQRAAGASADAGAGATDRSFAHFGHAIGGPDRRCLAARRARRYRSARRATGW